jgi:protein-S-isoprenylcysteine O-methyltransferase Ste14
LLLWLVLAAIMLASLPLGWWLVRVGRTWRGGTQLTWLVAFGVYVPLLIAAPLLRQPRTEGLLLPVFGAVLMATGLIVRLLAMLEFRRHRTSVAPKGWIPPRLVQTGIYGAVRHPMYLSDILLFVGWCCVCRALYALSIIAPLAVAAAWLRGYLEERYLLKPTFSDVYRRYQQRAGMLLPHVRRRGSA